MAKEIHAVLLSILAFMLAIPNSINAAEIITTEKRIILAPGHSTEDTGIQTLTNITEHGITLELVKLVKIELADGFQVKIPHEQLTEDIDTPLTSDKRKVLANQSKADLFINLHLHQGSTKDTLIFYYDLPDTTDPSPWQSETLKQKPKSKKLAETLSGQLKKVGVYQPSIYSAPLIPLEGLLMPAILVEVFSISQISESPNDNTALLQTYAKALADTIRIYFSTSN
ncbi:MAG: N-acetylmuramoyl-L-alanine amidase [Desulfobacterales bacterium]|nr:N-acetylmuramoyl-L-alanine amidase [Desulfobacterales bacterium]